MMCFVWCSSCLLGFWVLFIWYVFVGVLLSVSCVGFLHVRLVCVPALQLLGWLLFVVWFLVVVDFMLSVSVSWLLVGVSGLPILCFWWFVFIWYVLLVGIRLWSLVWGGAFVVLCCGLCFSGVFCDGCC